MRHASLIVKCTLVAVTLASASGCKTLVGLPFVLWGKEPTREVPAEYPYLSGKRVAILVWAESETLFEFPWVQLEVAEHVAQAMKDMVTNVAFIPCRNLVEFQRKNPDWDRQDPAVIGARFRAERVLMVELTQYTTREPQSPHLYRGRISANLKVYDTAYPKSKPAYKSTVETIYPPDSPGQWGSSDRSIRKEAMEAFADEVAQRFYDHQVKVQ